MSNRFVSRSKFFVTSVLFLAMGTSCKEVKTSDTNALESNDWFRDGKDRFYLAHQTSPTKIGTGPEKEGEHHVYGIGCYGESKDPQVAKQLAKRHLVSQFPILPEGAQPQRGKCKILFGDLEHLNPDVKGEKEQRALRVSAAAADCAGMAMNGVGIASIWFAAAAATGAAATATVATGGAAAPAVAAGAGASAVAVKTVTATLMINASIASIASVKCFTGLTGVNAANRKTEKAKNQDFLLNKFDAAWERMNREYLVKESPELPGKTIQQRLDILVNKKDFESSRKAVAILNKIVVKVFNEDIDGKFEQGWGNKTRFFDSIVASHKAAENKYKSVYQSISDE